MSREYNKKGNPFKRGKTWTFIYYVTDENGKRVQKWKGGYKTKKEAEADLKIYQAKAELNQIIPTNSLTVEKYICKWFDLHKKMLEPNTINGYYTNIHKHIIPSIGKIKLKDLKPTTLEQFYISLMEEKGLSAKTVKYIHNVLKTSLKSAVDDRLLDTNVCLKAKTPKVPKFKGELLSKEQLKTLFEALNGDRYETEIKLAATLGLRRGEVLGLKFSDLNTEKHTLHIQRQVSITRDNTKDKHESYYGLKSLKSESSNRVLYISEDIEDLILRKQIYNNAQKENLGTEYHDYGLICCSDNGEPMSPQTLYHAFKRIIKICGFPNSVRFHDLRHSYATLCIDLNVPIKVISQALGHSSTAVTDEVYADSIEAKKNLADIISQAVKPDEQN
ncbi:MAG: site-specific integrase [Ruminococcus flavefaciens]|nr:site-specific integrase [Ruminococcus flavefaciens]MCM1363192.1 site-specific integrase [Clostridiales bacterium]MCM1435667.1 site-specific integrase [Ruminococcus flavefaciens]